MCTAFRPSISPPTKGRGERIKKTGKPKPRVYTRWEKFKFWLDKKVEELIKAIDMED